MLVSWPTLYLMLLVLLVSLSDLLVFHHCRRSSFFWLHYSVLLDLAVGSFCCSWLSISHSWIVLRFDSLTLVYTTRFWFSASVLGDYINLVFGYWLVPPFSVLVCGTLADVDFGFRCSSWPSDSFSIMGAMSFAHVGLLGIFVVWTFCRLGWSAVSNRAITGIICLIWFVVALFPVMGAILLFYRCGYVWLILLLTWLYLALFGWIIVGVGSVGWYYC